MRSSPATVVKFLKLPGGNQEWLNGAISNLTFESCVCGTGYCG